MSLQFGRPPATREELWWFVYRVFGVKIPRTKVCDEHDTPFDAFADAYFGVNSQTGEKASMHVWHASRGLAGKSMTLSILSLVFAYVQGADLTLLGGSMAQSTNVHEYIRKAMDYKNVPLNMVVDETSMKILLTNRARIRPLTASQRTVRGPHPSVLLMDEVDEMDLAIYDAALGQPMPQDNYRGEKLRTCTVASSTWQNADGTFTKILDRAEEKGHRVYRWCYRETSNPVDGWLTQETIDEKKSQVSEEMFRVEYDLGQPSIGNRAYDSDAVEAAFCLPFEPLNGPIDEQTGLHKGIVGKDFEEYVFEQAQGDGQYVMAADWGKENDYTVIGVARLDGRKLRLVYYARMNRRPYPVMIGYYDRAMSDYNASGTHDKTGLGNVVNDLLTDDTVSGFQMSGEPRSILLSEHVIAVERGLLEYPRIQSMYREMLFCRVGDLYRKGGPEKFHLPDTVCMAALLHHQASRYTRPVVPVSVQKANEPTPLERHFSAPNQDAQGEEWSEVGAVRQVGERSGFSLSV